MFTEAVTQIENLKPSDPLNQDPLYVIADASAGLGDAYSRLGRTAEARAWYQKSLDTWHRIHNAGVVSSGGFECGDPTQVAVALAKIS